LPNCSVLVTSRRRLHGLTVRGAVNLPVTPLTQAESTGWLAKWLDTRADAEPGAVAELAALCGGIALALRMVVDHLLSRPGIPLAEFVSELRDERILLGLGEHGDDPGSTVRAALGRSYDALGTDEQQFFRLLGVNPGPDISLQAAAALFGEQQQKVAKGLDFLVDFHLLGQPESRTRYQLHDLLRQFARELVTDLEERRAAEERLISFYLFSAQNADRAVIPNRVGVSMPPLIDEVRPAEFADQESAIKWAVRERSNIISIMKYAVDNGFHEYGSKLPSVIGEIFQRLGYRREVATTLRIAIHAAKTMGDRINEASWKGNLAFIEIAMGEFDAAQENILSAKALCEQLEYPLGIATMDHYMGRLLVERGEVQRGIEAHEHALAAFRRIDAKGPEVIAQYRLGEAYRRANNLENATSLLRDALWNADRMMDSYTKGCVLAELAAVHMELGDMADTKGYCQRALEIHEDVDPTQSGKVYNILASVYYNERNYGSAELYARRALAYCRDARDSRGQALALRTIGESLHQQARHEQAVESWSLAVSLLESTGDRQAAAVVRDLLSEAPTTPPDVPHGRTESPQSRHMSKSTQQDPVNFNPIG
jgi:tetratricopeptide (TPR) repeat protein